MSIKSYALKDFQKHQEFTPICFPKRKIKFLFLFVTEFLEIKITQDLIFPIDHSLLSNNIENMPQLIQTFFLEIHPPIRYSLECYAAFRQESKSFEIWVAGLSFHIVNRCKQIVQAYMAN
jgi:hypothetical protein